MTTPQGKLRLLYDAGPLSFLLLHAGGAANTGSRHEIIDLVPISANACTPAYLGSTDDVADFVHTLNSPPGATLARPSP